MAGRSARAGLASGAPLPVSRDVAASIVATIQLCGAAALSDVAQRLMEEDLEQYPETSVLMALARCRRELRGRLTLADIIERIDDGRPGAEAAWAAVSDSTEAKTLVLTEEMQQALAAASPLMPDDLVAARMAFIETYRRLILTGRAEGRPIKWRVSLGQDAAGRLPALREAVEKGRIKAADARALLPAHEAQTLTMPEAEARRMLAQGERRAAQALKALPAAAKAMKQGMSDDEIARRFAELAKSLEPKRETSKPIDWQAAEQKLRERHGETR